MCSKSVATPKTEVEIQTHQNSNADLARWYIGVCSLHNCSPVFCGGNYEGLLRSPVKPFQGGFACVYLGNRVPGYCLEVKIWLWYLKYIKMAQGKFQLLLLWKTAKQKNMQPCLSWVKLSAEGRDFVQMFSFYVLKQIPFNLSLLLILFLLAI